MDTALVVGDTVGMVSPLTAGDLSRRGLMPYERAMKESSLYRDMRKQFSALSVLQRHGTV